MLCRKIITLLAITVTVNAQFESDRRFDGNRGGPGVSQEYQTDENARINDQRPTHRHRNFGNTNGFGGANEGRLRTNLNSGLINQHYQPNENNAAEDQTAQFDVHSSRGRVASAEGFNNDDRQQVQSYDAQQRQEEKSMNLNQRPNQNYQTNVRLTGQIKDNTGQRDPTANDYNQNVQENYNRNQNYGIRNNDQTDSRSEGNIDYESLDARNADRNNKNSFRNQGKNNQRNINQNARASQTSRPTSDGSVNKDAATIDSKSRAIADRVTATSQSIDREAMDREINNQITNMYFDQSTDPKASTKSTKENELSSRRSSGKKEDGMWVWGDGTTASTASPVTPEVDDRAAFVGDACPTGKVKLNGTCVVPD